MLNSLYKTIIFLSELGKKVIQFQYWNVKKYIIQSCKI